MDYVIDIKPLHGETACAHDQDRSRCDSGGQCDQRCRDKPVVCLSCGARVSNVNEMPCGH